MPRTRKPPEPPEKYEVQINPNTLAIALESALQSATAPLYEEIAQLKAEVSQLRAEQARLAPEYVTDVRGVVAGIEERRRAAELEGQAERIGEATEGIIDGARQLEQTAAAVARLDGQLEQQAERLSGQDWSSISWTADHLRRLMAWLKWY